MEKIKKIITKIEPFLLPIYIVLNILYVLIGSYYYEIKSLSYYKFSKGFINLLFPNIIILIYLIISKIKKNKKVNFNLIDLFLLLIIIFSFISVLLAKKVDVALYGMPGRYEGLYQICYYFSLFMLTTFIDKKYKKILSYTILIVTCIETIYAYFQVMNIFDVVRYYRNNKVWATGFTTNPNFYATISLLGLSTSIGLLFEEKKHILKIMLSCLIVLLMTGLLISNTMSCVVGLLVVIIYTFIYIIVKKKYLYFSFIILLIIPTIYIASINKTTLLKDFIKTTNETKEIVSGNIDGEYGTKRIFIWTKTLEIVPKNIIHGVGIDNFYYAFGDKPISKGRWFFDKAHNEYLQVLITEGIFSLISYLSFFGIIVIRGIKESFKDNKIYLILPVIGYLAQAFFNISVIEVAPYFYIILGLCVTRNLGGKANEESKRHNTST